jgi:hypothetical protein
MLLGRLNGAAIVTPASVVIVEPGCVSSQLPPASPARSTITLPGFIAFAASAVTSFGAGRPGTSAVVITTSDFATWAASASRCACCSASVSSRA